MYCIYNLEISEARPIPQEINQSDFNFTIPQEINQSDFNFNNNDLILSNAHLIATELSELNQSEIKDYPFIDLPAEEIKAIFMILDSDNLSKVLLNIDDIAIKNIYDKLTPMAFNKLIEKILESNKTKMQIRVQ